MTLPASGAISFNAINVELGVAGTTSANINQASYRTLAGVPSGTIALSNFYGKSNEFTFSITSNQTNANLRTLAVNAGWNQSTAVVATISGGVYISSNATGTPALTINGSFPGGVTLTNNGFIIGMGGNGGAGGLAYPDPIYGGPGGSGSAGGLALSVSVAVSINNAGTIGGGGGGGGGGGAESYQYGTGGGGGGGGRSSNAANSSGGAFGYNADAGPNPFYNGTAGSAGTVSAAGSGGAGKRQGNDIAGAGGTGGGWGTTGSTGVTGTSPSGYAPTHGAGGSGGSGGAAVSGNSNITWIAFGTRLGSVS